jgi:hypothetical protein
MDKKEKKIIFSEEVDNKISGLAVVLGFLSIGIFLLLFPSYFGNKLATALTRWIFILIGIIGLIIELSKTKGSNIKGLENFIVGIVLLGMWTVLFLYKNIWWINIISFFIFLIGLYGLYLGSIQIVYSIIQTVRSHKETKKSVTTDIGLLLTKVLGLVLVILQLIKVLGTK